MEIKTLMDSAQGLRKLFTGPPFENIATVWEMIDFEKEYDEHAKKYSKSVDALQHTYTDILKTKGTLTKEQKEEWDKALEELNEKPIKVKVPFIEFSVFESRLAKSAKKEELGETDLSTQDIITFINIGMTKKPK